jgi:hypothetical protein
MATYLPARRNSMRYQYPYNMLPYPYRGAQSSQGVNDYKNIIIYSTLGLGVSTGMFFLIRHFVKKAQVSKIEAHSLEEGDPGNYAKMFKAAFENDNSFGWGTDEELVFNTMRQIPTKAMYQKVQNAYKIMYGSDLNADLADELDIDELTKAEQILNLKS